MSVLGKVSTVADTTLDTIKVVPNPYIVRSRFNETSISRKLRFTNLPQRVSNKHFYSNWGIGESVGP